MNIYDENHYNSLKTKSDKIRYLDGLGWHRQKIADTIGIRYQHVRNVLVAKKPAAGKKGRKPTVPRREILENFSKTLEQYNICYRKLAEQLAQVQEIMQADRKLLKKLSEL